MKKASNKKRACFFAKDSRQTHSLSERRASCMTAAVVGIILNCLLFAGKFTVGSISGAISITADAFNNLSDAGSQIVSLISFRISAKPADRNHPFGHARIEYVASMIVSFLVLLVGWELFSNSLGKLVRPEPPSREGWVLTLSVLASSVAAKLWLGLYNRRLGKKFGSPVMRATAADSFSDALSTFAVMVGMVLYLIFGWVRVDSIVGMAVSVVIFAAGVKILVDTKNLILGRAPSDEIVKGISRVVDGYPGALGIHDMVIHNYGPGRVLASLHIEVDGKGDIFELHEMIDDIEKKINSELQIEATIHMDPIVTDDERVDRMRAEADRAVSRVDESLRIHDFRCVIGKAHTSLIFDVSAPYELRLTDDELRAAIAAAIREINPDYNAAITVDRE